MLQFKCTKCSNKYTRRVNLNKHEWIHHAPMKPNYQCSSCASTCTTSYNIRVHMRDFHGINIDPAAAKALNKPVASRCEWLKLIWNNFKSFFYLIQSHNILLFGSCENQKASDTQGIDLRRVRHSLPWHLQSQSSFENS